MQELAIPGNIKLSWDRVVSQFDNLIKFAARQQVENHPTDNLVSAEDLYQEGMIKLFDCWKKWCVNPDNNKDMDEFGPIFRTSLFRHMRKHTTHKPMEVALDDPDLTDTIGDASAEDAVERMYRDHGLMHLREMLSSATSKALLDELIQPSVATLFHMYADMKRKEMLKSQGKRVNVPKDTTVRMKHIQRALCITTKQYDIAMCEIRENARLAMDYQV